MNQNIKVVIFAGEFGAISIDENNVITSFQENPKWDNAWINGGFFVLESKVFYYIDDGDYVAWEQEPLRRIVADGQLMSYKHTGFWRCMDTLNDKCKLNELWESGNAS